MDQVARLTFREAALSLLEETGEPLHYKELARRMLERELARSSGRTPEETLRAMMMRDIRNEATPVFAYLQEGFYGLARWGESRPLPRRAPTDSERLPFFDEPMPVLPGMEHLRAPRAASRSPRPLPAPPPGKRAPSARHEGPCLPFDDEPAPPAAAPAAGPEACAAAGALDVAVAAEPVCASEPLAAVVVVEGPLGDGLVIDGRLVQRPTLPPLPPPAPVPRRTLLPPHLARGSGQARAALAAAVLLVSVFAVALLLSW